jgi:hypothetical protein
MSSPEDEKFSDTETQRRTSAILRGAFAGAPTPLKDIPTRAGEPRAKPKRKQNLGKVARQRGDHERLTRTTSFHDRPLLAGSD